MVEYGLKDKVALITGMNNPYGIGATTALALAREGAKLVLVYKRIHRPFDENKSWFWYIRESTDHLMRIKLTEMVWTGITPQTQVMRML